MSGGWIRSTAIIYEPKEPHSDTAIAIDHNHSFRALQEPRFNKLTFVNSTVAQDCEPLHIRKSDTVSTSDLNEKVVYALNGHNPIGHLHLCK